MRPTKKPSLVARLIRWQGLAMTLCCAMLLLHLYVQMSSYGNGDLDKRMSYFAQILAETAASAKGTAIDAAPRLKAVEKIFVKGFVEMLDGNANYTANYEVLNTNGGVIYQASSAALSTLQPNMGFSDVTIGDERFRVVRVQSSDGSTPLSLRNLRPFVKRRFGRCSKLSARHSYLFFWCVLPRCGLRRD
jgi:hypothetical protein